MVFWNRIAPACNRWLGVIPYSIKLTPSLELKKEHGYRATEDSPSVRVQILSLDRVWQGVLKLGWIWESGKPRAKTDTHVNLRWTPIRKFLTKIRTVRKKGRKKKTLRILCLSSPPTHQPEAESTDVFIALEQTVVVHSDHSSQLGRRQPVELENLWGGVLGRFKPLTYFQHDTFAYRMMRLK